MDVIYRFDRYRYLLDCFSIGFGNIDGNGSVRYRSVIDTSSMPSQPPRRKPRSQGVVGLRGPQSLQHAKMR